MAVSGNSRSYGFNDKELVAEGSRWGHGKIVRLILALAFITAVFFALNQKLIFGKSWISETYDNEHWRTNEGNLHTFGAWDIEAHIWKTEFIIENFPNFNWNPYWYLGMPLLKYYQSGFYFMHWIVMALSGLNAARASLILVLAGHFLATLMTFLLCYKVSKKIWTAAMCSVFVLSNTFLSLRSYGWEPITVIFLFLYPLGLYLFLKEPLRPFRFWLILVLGISYVSHPLIWFSLCMTMGIYLFSIAIRDDTSHNAKYSHYILHFIGIVFISLMIGAIQFLPQITYKQATSGAHMGVKYLPYYQVPPNIIDIKDFLFDAGNLKGPGLIIMISFALLIYFAFSHYVKKNNVITKKLHNHELVVGLGLTLVAMVTFYYLEFYNVFPMNFLRSIQYHRMIPEYVITAAVLVAALSNLIEKKSHRVIYYSLLFAFMIASGAVIYNVQAYWQTTDSISEKPEFIYDDFEGRISFPYTDQSLAVRSSFNEIPQAYGYYEQGITNPYNDEIFSVSSGFHNADLTLLYLKAANIGRLYVNMEEGERDRIISSRLNSTMYFNRTGNPRYGYFKINLANPSFAQAVDNGKMMEVQQLAPKCRIMFKEKYCGSFGEEFVSTDIEEIKYLRAYVGLLEQPYTAKAGMKMINPNHYSIDVKNATSSTAIVVKMTYDGDFYAEAGGKKLHIEPVGPYFMLIKPGIEGNYQINLKYGLGWEIIAGIIVSILALITLSSYFLFRKRIDDFYLNFDRGDMK